MADTPKHEQDLCSDPLLRDAPTIAGFKVLDPAVLYAKIGQGGMGAVYRGRHFKLDIDVAVKCLKPSLAAESPDFVARFEREARLAAQLTHQNVVHVMDVFAKHGLHYLVMEFVAGETARERVLRKGKLAEQEALAILLGAVSGLAEAHACGIVHRDIKPDNVLVSLEGRVKLADLGLAKAAASTGQSISLASGVMGTPQYMAPEQWDSPDVGPAADVWALGASLYYLLVGEHAMAATAFGAMARRVQEEPFPSLRDARKGLGERTYDLLERCVARRPDQRFADARALLKVLKPLVEIEEDALADAASGAIRAEHGNVSPPPRQTLMTIRAEVESGLLADAGLGGDLDSEVASIPSGGRRHAASEVPVTMADGARPVGRGKRWFGLAALAGVAAIAAWFLGWFDEVTDWDEVMRHQRAKDLYWEAKKLLPKPDGLAAAIAKLEQCLLLMPKHELARAPLAMALDKRAEKLTKTDLDAAYVASERANELASQKKAIAARFESLQELLRRRLFDGLQLTLPVGNDVQRSEWMVVPTAKFELLGTVSSKGFKNMQVLWADAKLAAGGGAGVWRQVPVIAGEFSLPVALPAAGDWTFRIMLEDEHGVRGTFVRKIRVAGEVAVRVADEGTSAPTVYNGAGCRMLPVQAGSFQMGSVKLALYYEDDEAQHEVTLTKDFWLAATEVTRAQWLRVMGTQPWGESGSSTSMDLPAANMSNSQAKAFCRELTELERRAGRLSLNKVYTLPSEAQWEFACRGGTTGTFAGGADWLSLGEHAVFAQSQARVVGERKANALGFLDMYGNVAEWCVDHAYPGKGSNIVTTSISNTDPVSILGPMSVYRGGSYASEAKDCRSAARAGIASESALPTIGFRPALIKL